MYTTGQDSVKLILFIVRFVEKAKSKVKNNKDNEITIMNK